MALPQVKARSAAREVIATYSVDDIFIELVIQLPQNYPLGSIAVESGRRVGVAVQQWRNWMLQLSTYLTHQVETRKLKGCEVKRLVLYVVSGLRPEDLGTFSQTFNPNQNLSDIPDKRNILLVLL